MENVEIRAVQKPCCGKTGTGLTNQDIKKFGCTKNRFAPLMLDLEEAETKIISGLSELARVRVAASKLSQVDESLFTEEYEDHFVPQWFDEPKPTKADYLKLARLNAEGHALLDQLHCYYDHVRNVLAKREISVAGFRPNPTASQRSKVDVGKSRNRIIRSKTASNHEAVHMKTQAFTSENDFLGKTPKKKFKAISWTRGRKVERALITSARDRIDDNPPNIPSDIADSNHQADMMDLLSSGVNNITVDSQIEEGNDRRIIESPVEVDQPDILPGTVVFYICEASISPRPKKAIMYGIVKRHDDLSDSLVIEDQTRRYIYVSPKKIYTTIEDALHELVRLSRIECASLETTPPRSLRDEGPATPVRPTIENEGVGVGVGEGERKLPSTIHPECSSTKHDSITPQSRKTKHQDDESSSSSLDDSIYAHGEEEVLPANKKKKLVAKILKKLLQDAKLQRLTSFKMNPEPLNRRIEFHEWVQSIKPLLHCYIHLQDILENYPKEIKTKDVSIIGNEVLYVFLRSYVDKSIKNMFDAFPNDGAACLDLLKRHCAQITPTDKSNYYTMFATWTHRRDEPVINYLRQFTDAKV
jgi:hypothetical protein